jgi:hypothetical protein
MFVACGCWGVAMSRDLGCQRELRCRGICDVCGSRGSCDVEGVVMFVTCGCSGVSMSRELWMLGSFDVGEEF